MFGDDFLQGHAGELDIKLVPVIRRSSLSSFH